MALPLPSQDEAKKCIEETKWFQEPRTVRLATGELPSGAMTVADYKADQVYRVLQELDLITIEPGSTKQTTRVLLTQRGLEASKQWEWKRSEATDGKLSWDVWQIPVATREVVEVLKPASGIPGTAVVEFVWKWAPTPLGEKLVLPSEPVRTSTSFKKDERGWRVVS
jgi:hypothetical protein